jgi:zinc protease
MENIMHKLINLVIILLMATSLFAGDVESFEVNGLKVIYRQNTANNIVAASLYWRGWTMAVADRQAGIESYALNVAQKATKNYPKDKLNAELERMNTRINSAANTDYSSLNLMCVADNFGKSWDIFADMVLNPSFNEEDVELVRQQTLAGIRQSKDDPDNYLTATARQQFFNGHPYANDVEGTEETVGGFSAADLKKYLSGRSETSQMLLVVIGNIDKATVKKMVEKSFGKLPKGAYTTMLPPAVSHQESSLKIVARDLPTKYIRGYFSAPAFGTEDSYPMMIAASILRDRLFEEVRTKRNLSYAPSAGYGNSFSNFGIIYVTAVDADSTIRVMMREVEKMRSTAISAKELRDKLNVFLTNYYLQNETNQSQANAFARYELSGAGYAAADKMVEKLNKVTPEMVREVCDKYMHNFQTVLLGNPAKLDVVDFLK